MTRAEQREANACGMAFMGEVLRQTTKGPPHLTASALDAVYAAIHKCHEMADFARTDPHYVPIEGWRADE